MNKTAKKSIIWGTTAAAIAGITVGITVPVVTASKKVTNTSPININPNDDSQMNAGALTNNNGAQAKDANLDITLKQLVNSVDNAGIKDTTLLTKLQYQLSFYEYNKEQEGSLQLQKMYFQWDLYSFNKRVRDMIKNDLHENTDAYVLSDSKDLFDTLTTKAKQVIDLKLAATPAPSDEEKALLNGYKSTLDTIKNDWTNKQKLIDAITNGTVNYDSATFSTDYSKTLLPLKNIRDKQMKIFGDTKASFMAGYSSAAEGNAEWQKQLSSKYNGATNDSQAIDYLVNQQVAASAWNKYKFAINKDFTFEQLCSNIFEPILGHATVVVDANHKNTIADKTGLKVVIKTATADQQATDKVFFFGTATKIPTEMNISGDSVKVATVFGNQSHIMQVQNAILGFKQGADKNSPWTVTKEQLTKLFSAFTSSAATGSATRAAEQWQYIFKDADAAGVDLTKTLISTFSDTTDATQWKSGNLGWQTQLSALGNYYEGFSLGIASALDDFTGGHNFGGAVHGSASVAGTTTSTNFLGDLMGVMREGLQAVATAKGWTAPTGAVASTDWKIRADATPDQITSYNKEISALLSTLSDSDIAQYFGKRINEFFMNIKVDANGAVAATGTALKGLPSTVRLDSGSTTTGVFLVNTDQPAGGIHIIKITTGTAANTEMLKEFQAEADSDKQDGSKIVTDWGKFISDSFTQVAQFQDVLGLGAQGAKPSDVLKVVETALRNQYKDQSFSILDVMGYKALGWDILDKDLSEFITSQRSSEGLARVQSAYRDGLFTWLEGKIDKGLWNAGGATHASDHTMTPDEIYGALLAAEGIK